MAVGVVLVILQAGEAVGTEVQSLAVRVRRRVLAAALTGRVVWIIVIDRRAPLRERHGEFPLLHGGPGPASSG
jgi:hypothetical protein